MLLLSGLALLSSAQREALAEALKALKQPVLWTGAAARQLKARPPAWTVEPSCTSLSLGNLASPVGLQLSQLGWGAGTLPQLQEVRPARRLPFSLSQPPGGLPGFQPLRCPRGASRQAPVSPHCSLGRACDRCLTRGRTAGQVHGAVLAGKASVCLPSTGTQVIRNDHRDPHTPSPVTCYSSREVPVS